MLQALEAVNTQLRELYPDSEELFDIVLMTNNHAQVGVRLINSINHYGELCTKHPLQVLPAFGGVLWLGSGLGRCLLLSLPPNRVLSPLLPIFLGSEWKLALFGGSQAHPAVHLPSDLFIERFCMTGGNSPICYLKAYHTNLYLSSDAEKVSGAIEEGESGVQPGGWGGCPEPTGVGARSDNSGVPVSMCRWGGLHHVPSRMGCP